MCATRSTRRLWRDALLADLRHEARAGGRRAARLDLLRRRHALADAARAGRATARRSRAALGLCAGHRDHAGGQSLLGRGGQFRGSGARRASTASRSACRRSTTQRCDFSAGCTMLDEGWRRSTPRKRQFERVSFDLIYARPGQTAEQWASGAARARSRFGTGHLSLYQLTIEPGTRFATDGAPGRVRAARRRCGGRPVRADPRNDRGRRPARLRSQQPRPAGRGEPPQPHLLALPAIMPASAPARMAGAAAWPRCGTGSPRTGSPRSRATATALPRSARLAPQRTGRARRC